MKPECHAGTQRGAPVEDNDPRMGAVLQRAVGVGGETRSHGLAWTEHSLSLSRKTLSSRGFDPQKHGLKSDARKTLPRMGHWKRLLLGPFTESLKTGSEQGNPWPEAEGWLYNTAFAPLGPAQ